MSDERKIWVRDTPPRGPGIFKVFWPVLLAWVTVAAPDLMLAASRYLDWHSSRVAWEFVGMFSPLALTIAVIGAIWVTRRYQEARDPIPMLINLLGVFLALLSTQIAVI